jgi:hypothetical protein
MGRGAGFIGLLIVVAIGGYLYVKNVKGITPGVNTPASTVDLMGARMDLLAIANAERAYFALNAKYATLDELRTSGDSSIPEQRVHFTYSSEAGENGFSVTATYTGSDPGVPRRLHIDETLTLTSD